MGWVSDLWEKQSPTNLWRGKMWKTRAMYNNVNKKSKNGAHWRVTRNIRKNNWLFKTVNIVNSKDSCLNYINMNSITLVSNIKELPIERLWVCVCRQTIDGRFSNSVCHVEGSYLCHHAFICWEYFQYEKGLVKQRPSWLKVRNKVMNSVLFNDRFSCIEYFVTQHFSWVTANFNQILTPTSSILESELLNMNVAAHCDHYC